jgi:uncharacterized protein (UPF0276 family)
VADRFGLGWRPELAAAILSHLDRIDAVEAIADDFVRASRRERRALRTLAAQVPLSLHGVGLGLASAEPVEARRGGALARLVDEVIPESWSEHLAFVRAGGVEIGHLAAPPRAPRTVDGLGVNAERARAIVGTAPQLENVATLIEPPGAGWKEAEWIGRAIEAAGAPLLLDLHNLHANAVNFGGDARDALRRLPLDRVTTVHLAGGRFIPAGPARERRRLLDDHLHDVPEPVYDLLTELGALAPAPLTVILERDGRYPPIERLLAQLDRARAALASGRRRRSSALAGRATAA